MSTNTPTPGLTQARIMAGSLLFATVAYAVVGTVLVLMRIIPEGGLGELDEQTSFLVRTVLLVIGILTASGSLLIRRVLDGNAPAGSEGMPVRFRNMILGMALGESAGVMGFVVALVTGDTTFSLLLWGVAIAVCVLHFPTQALMGAQEPWSNR